MCAMVGPSEILLILVVVLIIVLVVRGPKVLPQLGEALGKTVKGVRENLNRDADEASAVDPEDDDSDTPTGQ